MPFDGLVLAAIRHELERELLDGRIDRIYQPSPLEINLLIHRAGTRFRLLLSAHPENARVHLTGQIRENPPSPPVFCMVLRKHLEGGRIRGIHQLGLDRILVLQIQGYNDLGEPCLKELICEIMGRHSNIILVNPDTKQIIDAIKRYTYAVSRHREVLPGREYIPPPEQHKLNPLELKEEEFRQALLEAPLETPVAAVLQRILDGISQVMAREILYRAGLAQDLILDHCGEHELVVLWQAIQQMAGAIARGEFQPSLVLDEQGRPREFAAFDLTHFHAFTRRQGNMNALVDLFYTAREEDHDYQSKKQSLLTVVRREMGRLSQKLSLQEESLGKAERAEEYRILGELLMVNLYCLKKGLSEVTLENFYDPEKKMVTISLDPRLSPVQNAQAYFKKYTKAKQTREETGNRIEQTQRELEYLKSVETAITQATTVPELVEIREELEEQGYLKPANREKKREPEKPRPLVFTSSDGFTILVGRNNKQNDYLTLRLAKGEDVWLHTRDIPGSHVLIRTGGRTVPETTLAEAASLAAYFSRARESQNVPVDYTLCRNVHKPRGARPGYVIYTGQRTLTVNPDQELVERLKA